MEMSTMVEKESNVIIHNGISIDRSHEHMGVKYAIMNNAHVIKQEAFFNCSNLEQIILSDNLTTIEQDAFNLCTNLIYRLPSSVGYLGKRAFANISAWNDLHLTSNLGFISTDCFMYSNFNTVTVEEGVSFIGNIFRRSYIRTLILPRTLKYISYDVISNCNNIVCHPDSELYDMLMQYNKPISY
jgi:hypothetical protein